MAEKQFKNNLQKIISASFFCLLVIVFLVVCYTMIMIARPQLIEDQQERVELLGNKIVADLSRSIVITETVASSLANVYTGMKDKDADRLKQLIPDLLNLPGTSDMIAGGGIWPEPFHFTADRLRRSFFWGRQKDNQLHYFNDYNEVNGAGYHHEKWYVPSRYAETRKSFWSESYVDPYSLQPMVTCSMPMFEQDEFVGVSTVDLKLEGLAELFTRAGREIDGYLFALDNSDKFLAFPRPELIRQKDDFGEINTALGFIDSSALGNQDKRFAPVCAAISTIREKIIAAAEKLSPGREKRARLLARESYQIDYPRARVLAALSVDPLAAETAASKKLLSLKVDNDLILHEPVTVTFFHIPDANWKLAVVVPDSRVNVIVGRIMGRLIFYLAAGLMITLLSAFLLLRYNLLLPLRKITDQLQQIEDDPDQDSPELEIASNNELGKLAYHFNLRTRELLQSRRRYRDLFENAKDAIFIHNNEWGILDVNQTMLTMYQVPDRETACSLTIKDFSAPENDSSQAAVLLEKALNGEPQEFEWRARRCRDGTFFDVLVNLRRSSYADKIVVIATVTDITEKLRNERELQKVSQLESLGLLAGGIAHDFNNLLTAIFGNIALARTQATDPVKVDGFLEKTENALYQATALTQQLLTFAKGGGVRKMVVDLDRLVRESAEFAVHGSNVKLEFRHDSDLQRVFVDEGQISQVISNLVINADQAMPDGGVISISLTNLDESQVHERCLPQTGYVRITISDQGVGISRKNLKKIFDPYFTTKSSGCGLGLALCFSIVRKHNGFISAESDYLCGTVFTVDLPAVKKSEVSVSSASAVTAALSATPAAGGVAAQKILVMDDEPELREVMVEILSLLGHSVMVASEGREAVKVYSEALSGPDKFDLLIVDLTVPGGMGGLETCEILRQLDPDLQAIVSSGYSTDPVMAKYVDYGFAGIIPKPFTIAGVKACIEMVVGKNMV